MTNGHLRLLSHHEKQRPGRQVRSFATRVFQTICTLACLLASWQGYAQVARTSNIVVGGSPYTDSMWIINRADWTIVDRLKAVAGTRSVSGINGLATDPTTGIHYAIMKVAGLSSRQLATIDIRTGAATVIDSLRDNFATIAFNTNGSLFGVTGDGAKVPETMYRINKATAAKTLFRTLGNGDDGEVIVYNNENNFFYHWSGSGTQVFERFDTTGVDPIEDIPILGPTGGEVFGAFNLGNGQLLTSNISGEFRTWDTLGNVGTPLATFPNDVRGLIGHSCTSGVTPDGPLAFCSGDSVILTVNGGVGGYQWYMNGSAVAGATNASFKAKATGHYNAVYTDSCSVTDSAAAGFAVLVYPNPVVVLSEVSVSVCPGATVATLPFSTATIFGFTGASENYVVPAGVTSLTFDVIGAAGGQAALASFPAGFGGRVQGTLNVTPGQRLNINVGGAGTGVAGGFNGGGLPGTDAGGGGGASDIRIGGGTLSERVVVAGGGGGNGTDGEVLPGGDGGNLVGANGAANPNPGTTAATGGSQVAGGNGGTYPSFAPGANGSFGLGGDGSMDGISGGGGGGYYGGGGGMSAGGGGGSSFTDPAFVPSVSVTHTQGYNNGNGKVVITYSLTGTYNIVWSGIAAAAGFTNVSAAAIPSSPLSIAVPAGAHSGIYNGIINFNNGTCYSTDYAFSVVVKDTPVVDTPLNQAVCNGDASSDVHFTSPVSGTTFSWTNDNTSVGLAASGSGDVPAFTGINTGTQPDTAHILVTAHSNGCSGIPVPFIIVVNPTPALSSPLTADACDSAEFVYVPNSATPLTTYTWSRDAVAGIANPPAIGSGIINEYLDNTTIAPVVVTYVDTLRAHGCLNIQTLTVTVNPTPKLTSPLENGTQCDSTTFTYVHFSDVAGTIFSWSRAAIAGNPAAHGTGTISEMLINTTPLPVVITYVDTLTANGCSHTQHVTVTVNPTPTLSSADGVFACDSVVFHYVPTSGTPGVTFAWSRDAVAGIANAPSSGADSVDEILHNTTDHPIAVVYTFTLTGTSCAPHVQIVTVTVNPTPVLSTPLIAPTICGKTLFSYEPVSATPGVVFTWMRPSTPGISNPAASGTGNPNEVLADTSAVKVPVNYVFTLNINGCTNVQNVQDTVKPRPRLTSSLNPPALCDSTLFVYMPGSTLAGTTFAWNRPFMLGILSMGASGTSGVSEVLHNTTNGDKSVKYNYLLTADGCISDTQRVYVAVHPEGKLSSGLDQSICSGKQFDYTPTTQLSSVTVSYSWARAAVAGVLPATTSSGAGAVHETLTNTTSTPITVHYVYEILVAGSCPNLQTVNVVVTPAGQAPSISTMSPASVCRGTNYQNFGAAVAPPEGTSYIWSAVNATVYATGNNKQYSLISFPNAGTAIIMLTSTTGTAACGATDSFVVTVGEINAHNPEVIWVRNQLVALINDVDSYQWGYDDAATLDSVMIPGAIDQSYMPGTLDSATKYYWVMTRRSDCLQKSYYNTPTGVTSVNAPATAEVKIYPNPAGEYVNVEVSKGIRGNIQVEVMNMLGQKMDMVVATDNVARIDVAKFVPGAYLVNCYSNGVKIASARFIKN